MYYTYEDYYVDKYSYNNADIDLDDYEAQQEYYELCISGDDYDDGYMDYYGDDIYFYY